VGARARARDGDRDGARDGARDRDGDRDRDRAKRCEICGESEVPAERVGCAL